jgi:dTDP-4-dehydrorhamnose reductase
VGGHHFRRLSWRKVGPEGSLIVADSTILVTGASGQVGGAVVRQALQQGLSVWAPNRSALDLSATESIVAALRDKSLSVVINCGAYTAVDKAEYEPELAERVNAIAPLVLAEETAKRAIPLIHVSTDYVFDGRKIGHYVETDAVNPVSVYGKTKEAGEAAVRAVNPAHAIVRTAWVLSADGANFLNTMLRLGKERAEVSVVDDQSGCPSAADDIAMSLLTIAKELGDRCGTWHFVNRGEATWYGLAAHIFAETKKRGLPTPVLQAIPTSEYPTPASRPANSRLATDSIERDFSIVPRPWQEAIDQILAQRLN